MFNTESAMLGKSDRREEKEIHTQFPKVYSYVWKICAGVVSDGSELLG